MRTTRRAFLRGSVATASAALLTGPALAQGRARVAVLGGGFAGASCARELQRADPRFAVTLVEENPIYTACPFSNTVIAGLRDIAAQRFGYDALRAEGVAVIQDRASSVDPQKRLVSLSGGSALGYDRLVLAPGIDIRWGALPGYDQAAAEVMPHAWIAGEQTLLLRRQLEAMADGGTVVISAPANPFRCPPGPYERASLIAYYLKTKKPRSKLIVLDTKDSFSKQRLFQAAWQQLYRGVLEWVSLSNGGKVTSVDPATRTLVTDFASYKADVANVIPPQRAGHLAEIASVADQTGWCPIDPVTFESRLQADIHVIGDAEIGLRRQCSGQGLRRGGHDAAARRDPVAAQADQHLLQPGGARLRDLDRRRLSSGQWAARRCRGCRRGEPRRRAARLPRSRGDLCGSLVPNHHGANLRLTRAPPWSSPRCWRRLASPQSQMRARFCLMRSSATPFRLL